MRLIFFLLSISFSVLAEPHFYLLSNPHKAEIKIVSPALHYVGLALSTPIKTALASTAVGLYPAIAYYATDPLFYPAMAAANSLVELNFWAWRDRQKLVRELKKIPDLEKVRLLSLRRTNYSGFLAHSQDRTDVIILETSKPLNDLSLKKEWGEAIPIQDPKGVHFEVSLNSNGTPNSANWHPTLQEFFDRTPIPEEVFEKWRDELKGNKKGTVQLEATMIDERGDRKELGALADGALARKLLKRKLFSSSGRSLPLVEISCESLLRRTIGKLVR